MSSNPWIMGVNTIEWQIRAAYGSLVAEVCGCGLRLWPMGCMPALSVTQECHCSCSMRLVVLHKCY